MLISSYYPHAKKFQGLCGSKIIRGSVVRNIVDYHADFSLVLVTDVRIKEDPVLLCPVRVHDT